jgi:hypothetical protein
MKQIMLAQYIEKTMSRQTARPRAHGKKQKNKKRAVTKKTLINTRILDHHPHPFDAFNLSMELITQTADRSGSQRHSVSRNAFGA